MPIACMAFDLNLRIWQAHTYVAISSKIQTPLYHWPNFSSNTGSAMSRVIFKEIAEIFRAHAAANAIYISKSFERGEINGFIKTVEYRHEALAVISLRWYELIFICWSWGAWLPLVYKPWAFTIFWQCQCKAGIPRQWHQPATLAGRTYSVHFVGNTPQNELILTATKTQSPMLITMLRAKMNYI